MKKKPDSATALHQRAMVLRMLEEVMIQIASLRFYLKDRKLYLAMQKELKELEHKYDKKWKLLRHKYNLTDKELAFAEARMVLESILYANDMTTHNKIHETLKAHLPRNLRTNLQKLAERAKAARNKLMLN